jgi:sulfite exporter TauE/SafE
MLVESLTALVIGLAGSLHCIGMCGPIALALPMTGQSRPAFWTGRLLYNIGRVITYSVIGFVGGSIGQTIFAGGYQRSFSLAMGVVILLMLILPSRFAARIVGQGLHARIVMRLKGLWKRLFIKRSVGSLFVIGLLNGFLPCGLVYIALAGALATGDALRGAVFMAMFGVGTIPVMLTTSVAGKLFGRNFKRRVHKLIPIGGVILAMLFILRGMSLGIPYISPKFETGTDGKTEIKCCHPADKQSPDGK